MRQGTPHSPSGEPKKENTQRFQAYRFLETLLRGSHVLAPRRGGTRMIYSPPYLGTLLWDDLSASVRESCCRGSVGKVDDTLLRVGDVRLLPKQKNETIGSGERKDCLIPQFTELTHLLFPWRPRTLQPTEGYGYRQRRSSAACRVSIFFANAKRTDVLPIHFVP